MICTHCGNPIDHDSQTLHQCTQCIQEVENLQMNEYNDSDGYTDMEADAMTLRDAGMGTDEDYGYYGE